MSLLEQLENNEAVLLMYLAGELPAEDRAEVEQLLASDANLRRELEQMREADARMHAALRDLDVAECPPLCDDHAVRQANRAMRQWKLTHVPRPEPVAKSGLAYPWFVYPIATAAAVLLAVLVWWGMSDTAGLDPYGPVARNTGSGFPIRRDETLGENGPLPTTVDPVLVEADARAEELQDAFAAADEFRSATTGNIEEAERLLREVQAAASGGDTLLFEASDL